MSFKNPSFSVSKLTKAELKQLFDLTHESKARKEQGKLAIYGSQMIQELPSSLPIQFLFCTEEKGKYCEKLFQNITLYLLSEADFKKCSGQKTPEGIGAVIHLPKESDLSNRSSVLILDQIQDPGNLGTLIRSAYSLGMDAVLFVKGGCDPFCEKALRASQGAIFHLPFASIEKENLLSWIKKANISPLVADMQGDAIEEFLKKPLPSKVALMLGNEGQGIMSADPSWQKISIPMHGNAESLNVAIAGSILMYLLHQKSRFRS